jgi:hypothetical protein
MWATKHLASSELKTPAGVDSKLVSSAPLLCW